MTTYVSSGTETYVVRMKNTGVTSKYLYDANNGLGVVNFKWDTIPNQTFTNLLSALDFVKAYLGVVKLNTPNVTENDLKLFASNIEIVRTAVETYSIDA